MFDLSTLRLVRRDDPAERAFSFVGIRLHPEARVPEFWLPQGFQSFPENDYDATVDAFFLLYRVMKEFVEGNKLREEKDEARRDPFAITDQGLEYDADATAPLLTFAKLNLFESVLSAFDELAIAAILTKMAPRPPADYEEIYRHLHRAIYLENDAIYLEDAPGERREFIRYETELVRLFCYVYFELAQRLGDPQQIPPVVRENASAFKSEYLHETAGLFSEEGYKLTIDVLKDTLAKIDKGVAYKDEDYWKIYDAVELFLYGELRYEDCQDGIVWGVTDYHPIWEDMCHVFCKKLFDRGNDRRIVFAHSTRYSNKSLGGKRVYSVLKGEHPFALTFAGASRNLLPDLVVMTRTDRERYESDFNAMVIIRLGPIRDGYVSRVSVKPDSMESVPESWVQGLRRKLAKRGWTGKTVGHAIEYKDIPSTLFDRAVSDLRAEYVSLMMRSKTPPKCYIIDFKYINPAVFFQPTLIEKLRLDIRKQAVYQLAFESYDDEHLESRFQVESQFVIPIYEMDESDESLRILPADAPSFLDQGTYSKEFAASGITLIALRFDHAAAAYLEGM